MGRQVAGVIRYILAHEVEKYERDGWAVSLMLGHHGAKGRYIAVKEG